MIYYLKGKITYKNDKSITLENQGIGFRIFCSEETLKTLKLEQNLKIYTFLHLREGKSCELYGLLTGKELELFEVLNEISGIGPRTALDLSSFGSLENLKKEMEKEEFYHKVKGLGKKKMQKILLELTGKIKEISKKEVSKSDEALQALISLGFSKNMAKAALEKVPKEIENSEERIKAALKNLGN